MRALFACIKSRLLEQHASSELKFFSFLAYFVDEISEEEESSEEWEEEDEAKPE
ncbi:hypothetical protein MKX01_024377, partial [Papaver californicum]